MAVALAAVEGQWEGARDGLTGLWSRSSLQNRCLRSPQMKSNSCVGPALTPNSRLRSPGLTVSYRMPRPASLARYTPRAAVPIAKLSRQSTESALIEMLGRCESCPTSHARA